MIPPLLSRTELVRWLREECRSPALLEEFERRHPSDSLVRLALRHVGGEALSEERLERLLRYTEPPGASGGQEDLLSLLANPGLTEAHRTQLLAWAQRLMLAQEARNPRQFHFDTSHPALLVLEALEAAGHEVPGSLFQPLKEALRHPTPKNRKHRAAYGAFLLERWGEVEAEDLGPIYELANPGSYTAFLVASHPRAPLPLLRRLARDGGEMVLVALSDRQEARSDAEVRQALLEKGNRVVMERLTEEMRPEEFRGVLLRRVEEEPLFAIELLEGVRPELARTVRPEDVLPLLSHVAPEMRLRAGLAWSRIGPRGESKEQPPKGRGR